MKNLILLTLALCSTFRLSATAQFPEEIIYKGKTYSMYSLPLEPYFDKHPEVRPDGRYIKEYPDGRKDTVRYLSSALYRDYIGTFEIVDGRLMVKDVKVYGGKKDTSDDGFISISRKLFPDLEQVHADWFTGALILIDGKLEEYIHMGWASKYSDYIIITVKNGILTGEYELTLAQFEQFKKSKYWDTDWSCRKIDKFLKRQNKEGSGSGK